MWTAIAALSLILALLVAAGMTVCLASPERLQYNGVTPSRVGIGASFSIFLVILLSASFVSAIQSVRTKAHRHAGQNALTANRAADDAASRVAVDEAARSCSQAVALVGLVFDQNDTIDVPAAGVDAQHECAIARKKILTVDPRKEDKSYTACLDMTSVGQEAGARIVELNNALSPANAALLRQNMNHFTWLSLGCAASAYRGPVPAGSV
jgi:hypothetical protein